MANLPELRSKQQIIGDLINGFLARVPDVNDLNRGSVISQFFHAIGQQNFKAAADVINMIDAMSVDRATGEALQRLAADANVTISSGSFASGRVNITDTSFQKISTAVYAGQPAPVAGSTTVFVADASLLDANGGKIYIGRGTPNVEGPLTYTSTQIEANGAYWSITLDTGSPTTKFHNIGESVILAQGGNRNVPVGSTVKTSAGRGVSAVSFVTTSAATIPDGEVTVTDVPVTCKISGTKGNVPRGSVREAEGLSFSATVFNDSAFVNGTPPDGDEEIRTKIKEAEQAKSKGTEQSIRAAAVGVLSRDDRKKVISSSILRNADVSTSLVFDDGTGYEPIFSGVGVEQVIEGALGGQKELQLRQRPIAHARVKSIESAPYNIPDSYGLEVTIQGETTTHYFSDTDFKVPRSATAFEVVSSINGDPNINFSASTADGASNVVIYPRDRKQNDITVERRSSADANDVFGFQTVTQYTLLLYKNDQLLYQDGLEATIETRLKSAWSTSIVDGDTLSYRVDGTPEQTITFTKDDFQQFDITATVNSFTSIDLWVQVMNALMPGVIATVSGENIFLTSARGKNNSASLEITGGTIKDKMFEVGVALLAEGRASDYTLNNQTGQVGLAEKLEAGDKITAGSSFTRANVVTTQLSDGPSSAGNVWMVVDGSSKILPSGLEGTSRTTFSKTGTKITIEATEADLTTPVGFDSVEPGDWMLAWTESDDISNYPYLYAFRGFWRVETVERGKITVDDGITTRPGSTSSEVLPTDRVVFVRSAAPMQKLSFSVGSLSQFTSEVESGIEGVRADIVGATVRISTLTAGAAGELAIVAADSEGKSLGFEVPQVVSNIPSQRATISTADSEVGMPSFSFSELGAAISDTIYTEANYETIGGTRADFIEILNRWEKDSFGNYVELSDPNKGRRIYVEDYDPDADGLELQPKEFSLAGASPLKAGDRYFIRTPYQFDSTDTSTVIIDGDTTTKVYTLPVARRLNVSSHSTPALNSFSADDAESSLDLDDSASFAGFSFDEWKAWRRASAILTDGSTYGIRVQSADFGPAGDNMRVGFVYPTSIDQTELGIEINNAEMIDVGITLPVATPRTSNWDGTTSFTVDVNPISGTGKEQIKYTWRVGTEPNFGAGVGGASVALGDVAIINLTADFLSENKDLAAKVVNTTDTTFTIEVPAGTGKSDNLRASSAENLAGVYMVTTSQPHNVLQGDRIGIWDTVLADGVIAPIDGTYDATYISPTQFSVNLNPNVPGDQIATANLANNIVTATTTDPHNLNVGNVILVSGMNNSTYNGLAVVHETPTANQFRYVRSGSSLPTGIGGRFDFQSLDGEAAFDINSASLSTGIMTVSTSQPHNLNQGDVVSISGVAINVWGQAKNEIQSLRVNYVPTSGSFELRIGSSGPYTPAIPYNATANDIETALFDTFSAEEETTATFSQLGSYYDVVGSAKSITLFDGTNTRHDFWFNVTDGSNSQSDPLLGGISHQVDILSADTSSGVATKFATVVNAVTGFSCPAPAPAGFVATITNDDAGHAESAVSIGSAATMAVTQDGVGGIRVEGDWGIGGFAIIFEGSYKNTDTPLIEINNNTLEVDIGYDEVQIVSFNAFPDTGTFKLSFLGAETADINPALGSADVQAKLEAMSKSHLISSISQSGFDVTIVIAPAPNWSSGVTYDIGHEVVYSGKNYVSLVAGNTNNQPNASPLAWLEVADIRLQAMIGNEVTVTGTAGSLLDGTFVVSEIINEKTIKATSGSSQTASDTTGTVTVTPIGSGNVQVTGDSSSGFFIRFIGGLSDRLISGKVSVVDSSLLTVAPISATVTNTSNNITPAVNQQWKATFDTLATDGVYRISAVAPSSRFLGYSTYTTPPIPYNANAAIVQSALESLSVVGAGNVAVTGDRSSGFYIEFVGSKAGLNVGLADIGRFVSPWNIGYSYKVGELVRFDGKDYACIQAHVTPQPPNFSAGYWQEVWTPLIGFSRGSATVLSKVSATEVKFINSSLYASTEEGDFLEFTTGALDGFRFKVESKSVNTSDPLFGGVETYTFTLADSITQPLTGSDFEIKPRVAASLELIRLGSPAAASPATDRIKVPSSFYSAAQIGYSIEVLTGGDAGSVYKILGKDDDFLELTLSPSISASLLAGDDIQMRAGITSSVTRLEGRSDAAIEVERKEELNGVSNSSYSPGDLVEYLGNIYEANTVATSVDTPGISAKWDITTKDLNGQFVVLTSDQSGSSFTCAHYHTLGNTNGSGGSAQKLTAQAKLARGLGSTGASLAFGEVTITAQEVVDYLTQEQADVLIASVESPYTGSETITTSTEDNDLSSGYLTAGVTKISTTKASRSIEIWVDSEIPAGSTITLSNMGTTWSQYEGTYTVFASEEVLPEWKLALQSSVFAVSSVGPVAISGSLIGTTPYIALADGENIVDVTDLDALISSPMFTMKQSWSIIPNIGEEIRLVATNTEMLSEFWNRLVVTGLSNVAEVDNAEYGRNLQVTTNTFGSDGSVQFTGGSAVELNVAMVGSGSELDGKVGVFRIPYELRRGLTKGTWIKLDQTVRSNKDIEFSGNTTVEVFADGIEIVSGDGTFQTKRATTQDETSVFRVERHGDFVAIIRIDGQPLGLGIGGVEEGDWVRIVNNQETAYGLAGTYTSGDRVFFSGLNWTAKADNGGANPTCKPVPDDTWDVDTLYDTDDTVEYKGKAYISTSTNNAGNYPHISSDWQLVWESEEWAGGNTGIYRVVRTFGEDAFWIENDNAVEGMMRLGNADNLAFYSYDSVMPGDTLVISGKILNAANAGRYVVRDSSYDVSFSFPTSTRIWVGPKESNGAQLIASGGNIKLGGSYVQVNVEEDEPISAWKRILSVGPASAGLANVIVDSPNLMNKFSSSNAAYLTAQGKLGYDTVPAFGIDAYKHYGGLIDELNRVVYGDPTSPLEFPGVRAAGTDIDIQEAIIKRITVALAVRVRTGISFSTIKESIKAAVAGYVNRLTTGEQVAISRIIEAASKVNGVASVVVTFPQYDEDIDQIPVGAQEKALIVDPTFDVTVSILGT